jgi:hypothetical protein
LEVNRLTGGFFSPHRRGRPGEVVGQKDPGSQHVADANLDWVAGRSTADCDDNAQLVMGRKLCQESVGGRLTGSKQWPINVSTAPHRSQMRCLLVPPLIDR